MLSAVNNNPPITVLQTCPRLNSGGIERGTVDVAIALQQAGYHSIVASGGGKMVKELSKAGVEHFEIPLYIKSPYGILQNSQHLRKIITDWNIKLVHARSRAPIWTAHHAMKGLGVALITSCHSPHGSGFLNLKKYYNRIITCGDRVIAISDFIADYLKQNYAITQDKLRIVHRGIDMQRFNPNNIAPDAITKLKKCYHIAQHKKIILLPGRITRWKGQDILIKALAQLVPSQPVHGIIIGRIDSQDFYKELQKLVVHFNLTEHITFIDECFDMPLIYAMADITLSTSRKPEAFGRVAVEGQAMKSLVIATNLGAAVETVIANKTGFLVEPDNPQQLAKTIQQALALSHAEKNDITNTARQYVETTFSKQQMLAKTLGVYRECLESVHHREC